VALVAWVSLVSILLTVCKKRCRCTWAVSPHCPAGRSLLGKPKQVTL
jgi:hypothetical protein